jgi:outer membrane protein assembly factor BamD (BamD/ComL family)
MIVSADAHATAIDIREGAVARVPAPAPIASSTPPAVPLAVGTKAPTPTSRRAHPPSVAAANTPAIVPEPAAETAEQLYARAEAALRGGNRSEAEAIWTQLLAAYPRSSQAATALYDLASLARTHDRAAAQAYLTRLLANAPPAALHEPAQYLSCRLHVEAHELDAATRCFQQFRAAFADSPHDAEVLAWLAGRAQEVGGCAAARVLADEYITKYPHGSFAARAASCKDAP